MGRRAGKLSAQLDAVEYLRSVKSLLDIPYKELSGVLGIPESVLSRYFTGDMLPSPETARKILTRLSEEYSLTNIVRKLVKLEGDYVDLRNVLGNPYFLKLYGIRVGSYFSDLGVSKVVTAATDGIPLAVAAATRLNSQIVIAKQYREPNINYLETSIVAGQPPRVVSLYLPRGDISRRDKVLIVDDILRTGRTLNALLDMIGSTGAQVVGLSILVAFKAPKLEGEVVDVVLNLSESDRVLSPSPTY